MALEQAVGCDKAEAAKRIVLNVAGAGAGAAAATAPRDVGEAAHHGAEAEVSELGRKVLGQLRVRDEGLDGRLQLARGQALPVDLAEEAVLLDGGQVLGHVGAEALGG